MKFPNLAKTFRALAEHGKDGFYKGRIAEAIVEIIKNKGGVMELEDLAKHTSSFVEPTKYTYAGEVTVFEVSLARLQSTSSLQSSCSALRMDKVRTDRVDQLFRSRFIYLSDRDHHAVGARNLGEHTRARHRRQSLRNGAQLC